MADVEMTELQRRAVEHLERARADGVSINEYCRAQGISARQIYDATVALRRRGLLPAAPGCALIKKKRARFVAVKISPTPASCAATVCRIQVGALRIECAEWPPRAWLLSVTASEADAAP